MGTNRNETNQLHPAIQLAKTSSNLRRFGEIGEIEAFIGGGKFDEESGNGIHNLAKEGENSNNPIL